MTNEWVFPQGSLARDGFETVVDGSIPGWRHTGLVIIDSPVGAARALPAAPEERIVVPISGSCTVEVDGKELTLAGRATPFHGPTDTLYVPTNTALTISPSVGARIAIATAPTTVSKPVQFIPASDVPIEYRGAGTASRQVHNFGRPEALDADRFIVVEVITPGGNWSSYPRHKHDEYRAGVESNLEEIYYFETAIERGVEAPESAKPFGFIQTTASTVGEIDTLAEVHTGDVVLVPHGWHGPAVAAPGFDMYYLNVMAGPDPDRTWLICDEPSQAWIRSTWDNQSVDPRLPYTAE
jgi:5-deoxy-glucuronate isomerase